MTEEHNSPKHSCGLRWLGNTPELDAEFEKALAKIKEKYKIDACWVDRYFDLYFKSKDD